MWNSNNNTSEMIWLRMCCRYALGAMSVLDCLPYLERPLDDATFIELLQEHRLLLLVYQVLSSDFQAYVSEQFLQKLKDKAQPIINSQLLLMRIARDVHQALEQRDVPHVFLKGPFLNQTLWGRRMMRYSRDLDLLVLPRDIFNVNAALRQLNFKSELSNKSLCFHQRFSAWTTKKDAAYWKVGVVQCIELHWKTHCTEFIFPANIKKEILSQFTHEEHVLYLCLHAAKHGWLRVIWLMDIVRFLQITPINISQVRALAKARHIAPVVDEMILLAEQWLGVTLCSEKIFIEIQECGVLLQKRVAWAKRSDSKSFSKDLIGRYFANAFCSSGWRQARLWTQIFLGAMMSRCLGYGRDVIQKIISDKLAMLIKQRYDHTKS